VKGPQRADVVFYTPFIGDILRGDTSSRPGGAETQIMMLAKLLTEHGARVGVIAYGTSAELPTELDGVRIIARPRVKGNKGLVGAVIELLLIWQALWRSSARTIVYRCAGGELGFIGLYARLARRRLVFSTASVVDFAYERLGPRQRELVMYKLGIRLVDEIVVQTEEQIELCEAAFGRRPTLIKSIEPLAELQRETPEAFLWIGRLVDYKRPYDYVELARAVPEARFWMIAMPMGADDQAMSIEELIARAQSVPNLELLPPRPHAEIGDLMARAVASVNTADFEGMPNVLLEAWCRGVPALVLRHDPGGVVSEHGLGGFAHGSPERLAELAREQWRSRADRSAIAQRCREYVAEHHSPEVAAQRWLEALAAAPAGRLQASGAPA
jgi:glycosyltransferase involved in cell wall biosynthesis